MQPGLAGGVISVQPRLRDKIAFALALGFVFLAPVGHAGLYIAEGGRVLTVVVGAAIVAIIIIFTLWVVSRAFASTLIGPNSGVCPHCGGTLRRGPLDCLIDPAPMAWSDESLRPRFGYVWGCGNCMWTDRIE